MGRAEEDVRDLNRGKADQEDLKRVEKTQAELGGLIQTVLVELSAIKVKVGFWSGLGGLAGSAVFGLIIYLGGH